MGITNKVRLERLYELLHIMQNHRKLFKAVVFDINKWGEEIDNYDHDEQESINENDGLVRTKGACGIVAKECKFAACALGSAGLHEPFMKKGLKTITDTGEVIYTSRSGEEYEGFDAAQEFFGLTEQEAEYLFDPEQYDPENGYGEGFNEVTKNFKHRPAQTVKPWQVARRVQNLIDHFEANPRKHVA